MKEACFYEKLPSEEVQCLLCPRKCIIEQGKRGTCRTRENRSGTLYSLVYATPCAISVEPSEKAILNKRLETIGWGLLLVMLGGFALVPQALVPKGLWSIGVGVIMLGLNLTRYYFKIKMSGFTTFLGIISLLSGVTQLLGMHSLDAAILLIVLGAYLIVKPWFDKRQLFGKAEDS